MKKIRLLLSTFTLCFIMTITALAGTWKSDSVGWWYQNDDGSYPANCWQWIDGNNDGIAECYYFDANGYCLMNTVTPDGCTVDMNGAWTENGIVQTKVITNVLPVAEVAASEAAAVTEVTVPEVSVNTKTAATVSHSGISATEYVGYTIIANTNTHKYHVPSCKSVNAMKEKNKGYCSDEAYLISLGYSACKNCH